MRAFQDIDNLIGRVIDGRYRVTERIGTGAMAAIYRAEQDQEPRQVALKVIRPEIVRNRTVSARFHREAKAASKLEHPGIVRVVGWGFEQDVPYIAMELIDGEDLFELLERERRLPQAWSVLTAMRICDALSVAHAAGVVHRDLKPENIMVMPPVDGAEHTVKILDFGIAKLVDPEIGDETVPQVLTKVGSAVGTPSHMAPEQARGDPVDGRTDIYALGVLLYEMTTGHLPFEGTNPLLVAIQQVRDAPPPPSAYLPELNHNLEALILRALEKSPDARPQSADAFNAELSRVFDELVAEHRREAGVADPTTEDTRVGAHPSDDFDSLHSDTDPTTLRRDIGPIRKLIDAMLSPATSIADPSSDDITLRDRAGPLDVDDDSTHRDPVAAPRPSSVTITRQLDDDDIVTGKIRAAIDSEAPIVTVVTDPSPFVRATRSQPRAAIDGAPRRAQQPTPQTRVGAMAGPAVITSAPPIHTFGVRRPTEDDLPVTSRSATSAEIPSSQHAPSLPIPLVATTRAAEPEPRSQWPPSQPQNFRGELEAMLKDMPRRQPIWGTVGVVLMLGAALAALVWALFIY